MKMNDSTVEKGQQRGGDGKVGRDSEIDEIIETDVLGHKEGDPIIEGIEDYDSYPHFSDLSQPQYLDLIRNLFSHKLIKGYSDARKELTSATAGGIPNKFESSLEKATELFNINDEELFNEGETVSTDSKLTQILGYEPADSMKECTNPLLVSELYLEGLSVEEIAELLEGDGVQARDSLKTVNLLTGNPKDEQTTSFEENNGRLSTYGDDSDGGITIDTNNL